MNPWEQDWSGAAPQANDKAPWEQDWGKPSDVVKTSRTAGEWLKDAGAGVLKGTLGVARAGAMLGDALYAREGFNNPAIRFLDEYGEAVDEQKSDFLRARERGLNERVQEAGAAAKEKYGDGAVGTAARVGTELWEAAKGTVTDPTLLTNAVAEQAAMLGAVGAGGRIAQGAANVGAKVLPRLAATRAGAAALSGAGTAGAVGSGMVLQGMDVGGETFNRLIELPDEMWRNHPDFDAQAARVGPQQAKIDLANREAMVAGGKGALATLLTTLMPGGASLEKAIMGKGGGLRAVPGAIWGEARQEGLEEGFGQLYGNQGVGKVNPQQDLAEGIGAATGQGAVVGGLLGGGSTAATVAAQRINVARGLNPDGTQPRVPNQPPATAPAGQPQATPPAPAQAPAPAAGQPAAAGNVPGARAAAPVAAAGVASGQFDYTQYDQYRTFLESGGRADAKATTSSATGLHQFTKRTWRAMVDKAQPAWAAGLSREQILAARTDPAKSTEMVRVLDNENAQRLTGAGQAVNAHTMYAAHHFGAGRAIDFAKAAPDRSMNSILSASQIRANPYLDGKTKAEAIAIWDARAARGGVAVPGTATNVASQQTAEQTAERDQASDIASTETDAAAEALQPREATAVDRVAELDQQAQALERRWNDLNAPEYGPTFDTERADLQNQIAALRGEREQIARDWPKPEYGHPTSFSTEAGVRLDGRYAIVDADALVTSHNSLLSKNAAYPQELQPRERDRAASEAQISGIVNRLDPARLGVSADAATGAPIMGADGVVESGNARTIALMRAYEANGQKAAEYRQFLTENAGQFGLSAEQVAAVGRPVLVRVRDTPVDRAEFARQANASTVAAMSPSEQARSDAQRIDGMEDLMPNDDGDFATSRDFIRRFMSRLPMTEQAGMVDASGALSTQGYARVRNAVLAKAYGNSPVLQRLTESMDDNLRNVSKALVTAAPEVAKMRSAIDAGARFDVDIVPDLMAAVTELSRLKDAGTSVADAVAQVGMFGEYSPEVRDLLQFLADNIRRPRRIADFIKAYYSALDVAGDPNQGSLLGDTEPPAKADLMNAARQDAQGELNGNPATQARPAATAASDPGRAQAGNEGRVQRADEARRGQGDQVNGPARSEAAVDGQGAPTGEWRAFPPDMGGLGIPRAEMPQIKAEHRGAFIQFLKGRGIEASEQHEVDAAKLKPTQAEFSMAKVEGFIKRGFGTGRSVLVSNDGYVLDGHHQWMAHAAANQDIPVIELGAPMRDLLAAAHEFPSVQRSEGATAAANDADGNDEIAGLARSIEQAYADLKRLQADRRKARDDSRQAITERIERLKQGIADYEALLLDMRRQAAVADFKDAMADLADIATKHQRAAVVPESAPDLMPTLVRLFDAAIRIVGTDVRAATRWVQAQLRANPDTKKLVNRIEPQWYRQAAEQALEAMDGRPAQASLFDTEEAASSAVQGELFSQPRERKVTAKNYDMARDNFAPPSTDTFIPDSIMARARDQIKRLHKSAAPVDISAADRARAEGLLEPLMSRANAAKVDYDQGVIDIASSTGALGQMLATVKSMESASRKLVNENGFDIDKMYDMLRSTIVVSSYADAQKVLDAIRERFTVMPGRIKNMTDAKIDGKRGRFLDSGYGQVLVNVKLPGGVIAEIQINTPEMLAVKMHEGHALYEIERAEQPGSQNRAAAVALQGEIYPAAAAAAVARNDASLERLEPNESGKSRNGVSAKSPVDSSRRNTLPSGNLTNSVASPLVPNSQPGGNLSGTFMGSPDASIVGGNGLGVDGAVSDKTASAADDALRQRFTLPIPMFGDVPYRASAPVDAGGAEVMSSRVVVASTKLTKRDVEVLGLSPGKTKVYAWRVSVVSGPYGVHSVIEAMDADHGRSSDGEVLARFKEVSNAEHVERVAPAVARAARADFAAQAQELENLPVARPYSEMSAAEKVALDQRQGVRASQREVDTATSQPADAGSETFDRGGRSWTAEAKPGKGLIKGKFLPFLNGESVPGGPFDSQASAIEHAKLQADQELAGENALRREAEITDRLRAKVLAGESLSPSDLSFIGLRDGWSDMRWFIPAASKFFGITSRKVRPLVADLVRVVHTEMGVKLEGVPPNKALQAIAKAINDTALSTYTESDLKARDAAKETAQREQDRQKQDDARRAQADAERGEFTLTGSDRAADVAEAHGQQTMFSRARTPAQPRNLVTLHNLTVDNLLHADNTGGLPVPSLGITKVDSPFNGFGNITLIGPRGMIDPESGVPVFDRDAYTGRFPEMNYKRPKAKLADAMYQRLSDALGRGRDGGVGGDSNVFISQLWDAIKNDRNPSPKKVAYLFERYRGPRMLYAREVLGKEIKVPMRDQVRRYPFSADKQLLDFVRKNELAIWGRGDTTNEQNTQALADLTREVDAAISRWAESNPKANIGGLANQYRQHLFEDGGITARALGTVMQDAETVGVKVVDETKLEAAIRKVVPQDDAGYQAWVKAMVDPLFDPPTITLRGREVEPTLDNLVAAMSIGRTQGAEKTMTSGTGKTAALLGKRFKSIAEIQAARDQVVSEAAENEAKKSNEQVLSEYQNAVLPFFKYKNWKGEVDTWAGLDAAMEALADAGKRGSTDAAIRQALSKQGFTGVDQATVNLARQSIDALRNTPTNYFEAKPQRAVGLDEFRGAVVPRGTDPRALAVLAKHGIEVVEHGKGEGARDKAIASLSKRLDKAGGDVLFSRAAEGADLESAQQRGMPVADLQAMTDRVAKALPNLPKVNVLQSTEDARGELRAYLERQNAMGDAEGAFHKGELYLFADNLASMERAEHVLATHEAGHAGLAAILGADRTRVMQSLLNLNDDLNRRANAVAKRLSVPITTAAEELLVDAAPADLVQLKGWRRVANKVRQWLARSGFKALAARMSRWLDSNLSDQQRADLLAADLMTAARDYLAGRTPAVPSIIADSQPRARWLDKQAAALGYENAAALAIADFDAFEGLAAQWRGMNPAAAMVGGAFASPSLSRAAPAAGAQAQQTPAQRADALIQQSARTAQPLDAVARAITRATGVEWATKKAGGAIARAVSRHTPESVKAGIVSDYGLDPRVRDERVLMQARQQVQLRKAGEMIDSLASLTREESAAAYRWMNETDPDKIIRGMDELPEGSVEKLQEIQRVIDKLSQEAVDLGQLDPRSYERNKFAYLHRSYAKHVLEPKGAKAARARTIAILGNQYKGRGTTENIPMAKVRQVAPDWWDVARKAGKADPDLVGKKLTRYDRLAPTGAGTQALPGMDGRGDGRVLDTVYLPAERAVPKQYADWRQGATFEVRNTKGGNLTLWRDWTADERQKMGEIDEARFAIAKTLHGMIRDVEVGRFLGWLSRTQAKPTEAQLPAGATIVEASESLLRAFKPGEWVKVPESTIAGTAVKKYGELAGKYVEGPVWNEVRQSLHTAQPFGKVYGAILNAWKLSKALALDTPLPTPGGWTTMGDLQVGDTLFDENGKPCTVLGKSEVWDDHDCYRVEFSDGTSIVADAGHLWMTIYQGKPGIRETTDILATLKNDRGDNLHRIPVAGALDIEDAELPVDPYVLGYWLGDGDKNSARLTLGGHDLEESTRLLEARGVKLSQPRKDKRSDAHEVRIYSDGGKWADDSIQSALRSLGVLGNKHIPALYLRASVAQRRALLRGIMDSDGCAAKGGMTCSITTSTPRLGDGILELIRSLGLKPRGVWRETYIGDERKSDSFRITFAAYIEDEVFTLPRKLANLRSRPETRQRSKARSIVGVVKVDPVPVQCILVSSPSHLFLAGDGMVPTHNTALSPTVHMNNIMSNFVMADWHDVTAGHVAKALRIIMGAYDPASVEGLIGLAGKGAKVVGMSDQDAAREVMKRYTDSGAELGSFVVNETMKSQIEPLLTAMEAELKNDPNAIAPQVGVMSALQLLRQGEVGAAAKAAAGAQGARQVIREGKNMIDLYQAEDAVFRLASWLKAKEEGKTDIQAGRIARESFMDYNINAPWVQAARKTFLPFVSYTYRAAPMMLDIAMNKPHKLLKLMAIAGAVNALGSLLAGGADDDEVRKLLPEEKAGGVWGLVPKLIRMPWDDKNGSPVFLDIRRWIPMGDVFDIGQGHAAVPIPPSLMPGGPLALAGELIANKSQFTGKPIVLETDTAGQKAGKVLDFVYKWATPNVLGLPGSYATTGVMDASKGRTDAFGRERSVSQAIASSVGVKLASYPPDILRRNIQLEANAQRTELERGMRQLARQRQQNAISDAEYDKAIAVERDKLVKLREKTQERLGVIPP